MIEAFITTAVRTSNAFKKPPTSGQSMYGREKCRKMI
jgi:hypothetical protein